MKDHVFVCKNGFETGTLPGKLKRKIFWALSYKILPSEITDMQEIAILESTLGDQRTSVKLHGF